ncbi:MAG: LTA synthase family protein [Lachnospira sp.]|nr:LTA synthase family protein [Lachnospira sp.]
MWKKEWTKLKKFGFIRLLLIMILTGMCIFVTQPERQNVAEASKEGIVGDENTGSLGLGRRARQRIYFKKTITLYSIDMRFDMLDGTANTEWLTVYIRNKKMEEITRKRVYTKDMKDGEMTRVRFSGGVELEGLHSYYVIVTGPGLKEGEISPAVHLASFTAPNKRLYVGGSLVKNQALDTIYNYQYDNSLNVLGMYIAGLTMIVLLLIPRWFFRRVGAIWGVGWALFISNPMILYWLVLHFYELQNGRIPATITYNCLLLFSLQCVLYFIIGNKYVTLLVHNGICFLFAMVNIQVSSFKGVPLLPSDFLFLKTAMEVSDQYTIEWTHTQLHYMIFMVVYLFFIWLLGTYRKEKTEGEKKRFALIKRMLRKKHPEELEDGLQEPLSEQDEKTGQQVQLETEAGEGELAQAEVAAAKAPKIAEQEEEDAVKASKRPAVLAFFGRHRRFLMRLAARLVLLGIGIYGIQYLYTTDVLAQNGISVDIWNRNKGSKKNGIYLDFFMNFHYLSMEKPEGYSIDAVKNILKENEEETVAGNAKTKGDDPNVIIIMNESLADYSILNDGANMTYNEDYLPFIHSLNENVIKGKCYVSVFGGQTANSEFECLTGNSLAFLPASSVPYQQYMNGTTFSLPIYMKTLGYQAIAIHPCVATNWNRDVAYKSMDFDAFLTQNDFTNPEYVRYISDKETYKKIIEQFEEKKKNDKLFIMGVTMQNHGGYTDDTEWEKPIIAGDGEYALANEYLSSAHISDEAYEYLLDYFKDYEEPTIILMFGDHQPSIEEDFLDEVLGGTVDTLTLQQMQEKYCTPYVIWANYDIDTDTKSVSSTNFIANELLEQAGIPLPKYNQYVSKVHEQVEAMNAFGYMTKDKQWHSYEETTDVTELMNNYHILEYGYFSEKNEKEMADIFALPLTE